MHGPTCIFWGNLTPFSLEVAGAWRLVPGDVESPVFPADRRTLAAGGGQGTTLRQLYEPALEKLMGLQGVSLADVFGGDTAEF